MQVKARNPLWETRDRYFFPIEEYEVFTGERVPTPKWVEYPAVCITAPIPSKFRIIPLSNVVSIDDTAVEETPKGSNAPRVVKVDGSKGKQYLVTIQGNVKSCNCTGYGFRRTCKHLALAS